MKLTRLVSAEITEKIACDRATAYFTNAGYAQTPSQSGLAFQRGSVWGSLVSFSPKRWKVTATLDIVSQLGHSTHITATLDIDTTGQEVTESERAFWESEVNGLEQAIQTGHADVQVGASAAQSSLRQNLMAGAVTAGLAIALAVGADLAFDSPTAFSSGGLIGIALGLQFVRHWLKINKKEL